MLIDEVDLIIKAGHGGAGKVSFGPGKWSGPDGGNGGRGGDVYIKVSSDIYGLNQFSKSQIVSGENGMPGGSTCKSGENGDNKTVFLPLGTELEDKESGEIINLDSLDMEVLIAKGGLGGRGNFEFRSPRNTTPKFAQKGLPGIKKYFKVRLKLIADFGLIGLPNAGKSSLLNELTNANAKIGDYQFTTLEPNLGVIGKLVLADIPGLIEGASDGKGLGIKFLKHIEKVGLLLHCVSAQSQDLKRDYQVIRKELGDFSTKGEPASGWDAKLLEKKEIILLTKTDLVDREEIEKKVKELKKLNEDVLEVSIHDYDSLERLKKVLVSYNAKG